MTLNAALLIDRSPGLRRAVRAAARFVNPLVVLIAGRRWMPILGILRHTGRRSGRVYSTPLGMRRLGGSFFIPRTFGDHAGWHRNLLAAGSVSATYRGHAYSLDGPEVVDFAAAAPAFPGYERALFRLIGIDDFLRLRVSETVPAASA